MDFHILGNSTDFQILYQSCLCPHYLKSNLFCNFFHGNETKFPVLCDLSHEDLWLQLKPAYFLLNQGCVIFWYLRIYNLILQILKK